MQESSLNLQMKGLIEEFKGSQKMASILNSAWEMFHSFLEDHELPPGRLEDINPRAMARFVKHCRTLDMDVDALVMKLTALRTLLMHAGFQASTLAALTTPTRRVRGKNDSNGKHTYQRQFVEPATGLPAAPNPFDEA